MQSGRNSFLGRLFSFFSSWQRQRRSSRLYKKIEENDLQRPLAELASIEPGSEPLLHTAAGLPGRQDWIALLVGAGYDVDALDKSGRAALHIAVEAGLAENVEALLAVGADPNRQDKDGVTPLNLSRSYHGLTDIADLLRGAGADQQILDKHGKNYLM